MKTAVGASNDDDPDDMATTAHQEDIAALRVAEETDPVMYHRTRPGNDRDQVVADLVKQANAGALLAYAMYHAPVAWWTAKDPAMPEPVIRAYMRACAIYGISR